MGMYATIKGEQVKMSGLIATTAKAQGHDLDSGVLTLDKNQAMALALALAVMFEDGIRILNSEYQLSIVNQIGNAAQALKLLMLWTAEPDGDCIFFA